MNAALFAFIVGFMALLLGSFVMGIVYLDDDEKVSFGFSVLVLIAFGAASMVMVAAGEWP